MNTEEIFREIGEKHGYKTASMEYYGFTDMKIRWQRGPGYIHLIISDYLKDAPEEAMRDLLENLFERIETNSDESPAVFRKWGMSAKFAELNQKTYLQRRKGLYSTKNLSTTYVRLREKNLVRQTNPIKIFWDENCTIELTNSSPMMRVLAINPKLNTDKTPTYVLDWLVYEFYCRIVAKENNLLYEALLDKYTERKKAEKWLEKEVNE